MNAEPYPVLLRGTDADMACIYGLVDPREPNRVRYVGKAYIAVARFAEHLSPTFLGNGNPRARWILSLQEVGLAPDMVLLERVETNCRSRELHWFTVLRARGEADLNVQPPRKGRDFPTRRSERPDAPRKPRVAEPDCDLDMDHVRAILEACGRTPRTLSGPVAPLQGAGGPQ